MPAVNRHDELPMRAHFRPTSSVSSSRAEAWYSTVAFFTYISPPSASMLASYGNASARQYSDMAVSTYMR